MAQSLARQYAEKRPGRSTDTLAVVDFASSAELARQRAGFAVAELIQQHLARQKAFTIIERAQVVSVFREQKLHAAGAVPSDKAAKLGQMLAARVLLLGSIDRFGGVYQVNSRLVDVESGEVVSQGFAELPREAFEEDARPYLRVLRPLFEVFTAMDARASVPPPAHTIQPFGTPIDVRPKRFLLVMGGLGLRFNLGPAWELETLLLQPVNKPVVADVAGSTTASQRVAPSRIAYRAKLGRRFHGGGDWSADLAAGVAGYHLATQGNEGGDQIEYKVVTPLISAGVAYRAHERVRLGLSATWEKDVAPPGLKDHSQDDTTLIRLQQVYPTLSLSVTF